MRQMRVFAYLHLLLHLAAARSDRCPRSGGLSDAALTDACVDDAGQPGDGFVLLQVEKGMLSINENNHHSRLATLESSRSASGSPPAPAPKPVEKDKPPDISLVMVVTIGSAIVVVVLFYAGMGLKNKMMRAGETKWYYLNKEAGDRFALAIDVAACFAMIIIFFCSYGIAQEFIMTQEYNGEKFPSVPFIIMANRVILVIVGSSQMLLKKESINFAVSKFTVIPSATVLISSWSQYQSLHYVTFPTQVVFKSAKMVPTMLINTVINKKTQDMLDYVLALVLTGCVIGFSLMAEKASSEAASNTTTGIILMIVFLLCDALTSNTEKWVYEKGSQMAEEHKTAQGPAKEYELNPTQMMFAMGVVTLVYSIIMAALSDGGYPVVFGFLGRHPEVLGQITMLALTSTFGQWVIYYTVKQHGPVLMAMMMTVRQIISIYVSAVIYTHYIPPVAGLCAAGAFVACLFKPIYKLMTQDKASGDSGKEAASVPRQLA